jgi:hypothetical protein
MIDATHEAHAQHRPLRVMPGLGAEGTLWLRGGADTSVTLAAVRTT